MKLILPTLALLLLTGCGQQPFNLEDHRVTPIYCDSIDGFQNHLLCVKNDVGVFVVECKSFQHFQEECTSYLCDDRVLFSTDCKTK